MTKIAKDIVDTRQLKDREFLRGFFDHTDRAAQKVKRGEVQRHHEGKIVASLFYEPSTRTKMSFDAAAKRLGADVIGTENARQFSSAYKGETLEHSLLAVEDCFDAVVIRHPESGAAKRGAAVLKNPLLTQAMGQTSILLRHC